MKTFRAWACLCAGLLAWGMVFGAELAGQKLVWAHYVAWLPPENVSQIPERFYDEPLYDRGTDPLRDEVHRALDMGIDGFFVDVCVQKSGPSAFWNLCPHLKASEGTSFQVGICLDVKTTVAQQVAEIVRMLSTYGDHPNYPKMNGKYVVATYTYFAWTPDEWAQIRAGCAAAGYPLHLVANVERGFAPFEETKLAAYADQFEAAYYFSLVAQAHGGREVLEDVVRRTASFCDARGKMFVPCLWPGYYGAWLNGRNCFHQPHLGFDTLHRRHQAGGGARTDWLHLTTWNDHDETTLEPRRLTTGLRRLIRAYAKEFKGQPAAAEVDVQFAYLRETAPGTMHRFEAMCLPTRAKGPVTVSGCLRNPDGAVVAHLPSRTFDDEPWPRVEWLVSTTHLATSPALVPEVTVTCADGTRTTTLPPVFLFAPYLRNPETVKVSVLDRRALSNDFTVAYRDGVLSATCAFDSDVPVRRATLYRNEHPIGAFGVSTNTILPLTFAGHHTVSLVPEKGWIDCAIKSFETNGMRHWSWNSKGLRSVSTPNWMKFSARIACGLETRLTFESAGEKRTFTPAEIARAGRLTLKDGRIGIDSEADCTLRDLPPMGAGRTLAIWTRTPQVTDAFWVQYEFADGTHMESRVRHPFAGDAKPVAMNVVETPVTMDWTSGACGQPDAQVFLTPKSEWPVREACVVATQVSPLAIRRHVFPMTGNPRPRAKLPLKQWPMGAFELTCTLIPHATDGKPHPLLRRGGPQEGPELRLLADGRLEAAYAHGEGGRTSKSIVTSLQPLARGKSVRIRVTSDCQNLKLHLDDVLQGATPLTPRRTYGNLQPSLAEGVNGPNPSVAELFDLSY